MLVPKKEIGEALSKNKTLYLASKGEAAAHKGLYGWVLQVGQLPIARGKVLNSRRVKITSVLVNYEPIAPMA
jgi:hypothetical protein